MHARRTAAMTMAVLAMTMAVAGVAPAVAGVAPAVVAPVVVAAAAVVAMAASPGQEGSLLALGDGARRNPIGRRLSGRGLGFVRLRFRRGRRAPRFGLNLGV